MAKRTNYEAVEAGRTFRPDDTEGTPRGRLQWKGTNACIDLVCSCGEGGHLDGWFLYEVTCGACGQRYAVSPVVELVPIGDDVETLSSQALRAFKDEDPWE